MSNSTTMHMPVPAGSLDAYMQAIRGIDVLSAEEEKALAIKLHENGDLEAARQ